MFEKEYNINRDEVIITDLCKDGINTTEILKNIKDNIEGKLCYISEHVGGPLYFIRILEDEYGRTSFKENNLFQDRKTRCEELLGSFTYFDYDKEKIDSKTIDKILYETKYVIDIENKEPTNVFDIIMKFKEKIDHFNNTEDDMKECYQLNLLEYRNMYYLIYRTWRYYSVYRFIYF